MELVLDRDIVICYGSQMQFVQHCQYFAKLPGINISLQASIRLSDHWLIGVMDDVNQKRTDLGVRIKLLETELEQLKLQQASFTASICDTPTSHASDAVQGVFRTAELLEAILMHLDLRDLCMLRSISTTFNETISGSVQIRRQMFLEPARNPHLDLLPSFFTPGSCIKLERTNCDDWSRRVRIIILYDIRPPRCYLGSQVRSMQLSRGPVFWLRAYPRCCQGEPYVEDMSSTDGITLGSIYDKALQIFKEHESCPNYFEDLKTSLSRDSSSERPIWVVEFVSEWDVLPESHPFRVKETLDRSKAQAQMQRLVKTSEAWLGLYLRFRSVELQGKPIRDSSLLSSADGVRATALQSGPLAPTWPQYMRMHRNKAPLNPPTADVVQGPIRIASCEARGKLGSTCELPGDTSS